MDVLSQMIRFLSRSPSVVVLNGLLQVRSPLVERLVTTALLCTPAGFEQVSEEMGPHGLKASP